jgi:type I restriction enzyme S subunit
MKKGWEIKNLNEVCTIFEDGDWIESKDQSSEGIRLIQTGNVGKGFFKDRGEKARYISEKTFKRLRCTEIFEGDCLISRLPDPVGRACILPDTGEKMITAVDCTIIRFNKKNIISEWFLFYSLSDEYQKKIKMQISGATRQRISRKNLSLIEIPLPSLSEQKHIVSVLDELFSEAEKSKSNAEQNLKNSKELFESYLENILENKNWEIKKLEEFYEITSSKRVFKSEWKREGVPFFRAREIVKLAKQGFVKNDLFISEDMYNQYSKKYGIPKENDIMVTGVGTLGICYVVKKDDKFYFKDGNIIWLKTKNNINSRFVEYAFKSNFIKKQIHDGLGAVVGTFTIIKANNTRLPIPSIAEQKSIVKKLDDLSKETKKLEDIYKNKITELEELKKSILQKAFNGYL